MSLPDLWAASSFSFLFFLKKEKSFAFPQMCPLNSSGWVPYHSQEAGLVHVWTQVAARPAGKQAPSDLGCAEQDEGRGLSPPWEQSTGERVCIVG